MVIKDKKKLNSKYDNNRAHRKKEYRNETAK